MAQRVFKIRTVVQPTARSVRLRRRSVRCNPGEMRYCVLVALILALASVAGVGSAALAAGRGSSLVDLHRTNWRRALIPAAVCGTKTAVRTRQRDAAAVAHSDRWPQYAKIMVAARADAVVYGDLYDDGHDAATLGVVCANLDGTAAGQLAFRVVVYRPGFHGPVPVGVLSPQVREKPHSHVPVFEARSIMRGAVKTAEGIYGPHDSDCCASGLARTVWRLAGHRLVPASTRIVRPARP